MSFVADEVGIITNDSDHGPLYLARDQGGLRERGEREVTYAGTSQPVGRVGQSWSGPGASRLQPSQRRGKYLISGREISR